MPTYAWSGRLTPGREEEYKQRHDEIWPEMVVALRDAGFTRYAIFRDGLTLFACFECDDADETARRLAASEVRGRWSAHMAGIMQQAINPQTGFPRLLELQWELPQAQFGSKS